MENVKKSSADESDVHKHDNGDRKSLHDKLQGLPDFPLEDGRGGEDQDACDDELRCVHLVAKANLPTRFGEFIMYGFYDGIHRKEHTALVRGNVEGTEHCPVRVHSECHTGDIWGSLRCDCRDQLEAAIAYIADQPYGAVVYMRQEGRGIGLLNKIKAYQLQELGLDTIEANEYLGFPADARDYRVAARIIDLLGIRSVSLLTNNPDKVQKLQEAGVRIADRVPVIAVSNDHNRTYLETKKLRMGHLY